jgi:mannonate dehydratase
MYLNFRWFGADDPVGLKHLRQVPGVEGIVSALHDIPSGDVWPCDRLGQLRDTIEGAGFRFHVVESLPVHEDIKLGLPVRDRLIDQYCESIRRLSDVGVKVLCYNFMPIFDWVRTDLAKPLDDGSTTMAYDHRELANVDLSRGMGDGLPAWANDYTGEELARLLNAFRSVSEEHLWEHLQYFLERVAPAAESVNIRLALHPDDPPWSVFGVPRIITDGPALERVVGMVDSPANGITVCTGSLGSLPDNDVPAIIRRLGSRVHFMHCRNVLVTGERQFHETPHLTECGDVDMLEVFRALRDISYRGPMRSDHGRMIWGESGRPGYGLHDRALGTMYLRGLWEAVSREPVLD